MSSLAMAMILLDAEVPVPVGDLRADLAQQWPALSPLLEEGGEPTMNEHSFAFSVGELVVAGGLMPFPVPWGDLEEPCAHSLLFKDATEVLRPHVAHVILTVVNGDTPIDRMRLLTQATASLVATCPAAIGVFWSGASLVIPPPLFREMAVRMLPDGLPLWLWIDFRAGRNEAGQTIGGTAGMQSLGHMEIETLNSPETIGDFRMRLHGMAGYLLERGPVIKDGNTIGKDENEKIRVVYSPSAFGHEGQVMRLVYGEPAEPRPTPTRGGGGKNSWQKKW